MVIKNFNHLESAEKIHASRDYMYTNFGERGHSVFGDKISLWSIKVENFNRSESAQKIYASRD